MDSSTPLAHRLGWLAGGLVAGLVGGALVAQTLVLRPAAPAAAAEPSSPAATVALAPAKAIDPPAHDTAGSITASSSAEVSSEPADAPNTPVATLAHARLASVPFRTQRDGSPYAGSNCGPAALGMVLESYGIYDDTNDLRYLSHTYQGTWPRRGGTALQHLAQVAEDFGLTAAGLYDGDNFRQWSVADVRAEVEQGHPVIVLAKYRLLPGHESSPVRYDHYVVLWDTTSDGFIYNDPIYPADDEGFARFLSNAQLDAAMAPTMEPRQAVAIY